MNKGGQVFFSFIVSMMLFLSGFLIINYVKDDVTIARNNNNLDCSNVANISDGNKLTCLIVDGSIIYLFLAIVSLAGGMITEKLRK